MLFSKKQTRTALGRLALAYFRLFLLDYEVASYAESDLAVDIVAALVSVALTVALSLSGAYALSVWIGKAERRLLGSVLPFAARLLYAVPYNYIYFVIAEGYSSIEAILLGTAAALLECALLWGAYLLLAHLLSKSERGAAAISLYAPLLPLVLSGARTLIDAIRYLVEFFERIYLEDLLFYLLDFALILLAFVISCVLIRFLQKKAEEVSEIVSD